MWRTLGKSAQEVGGDHSTVSKSVKDMCFRSSKWLTLLEKTLQNLRTLLGHPAAGGAIL